MTATEPPAASSACDIVPRKVVTYPVGSSMDGDGGGAVWLFGPADASRWVVMCGGFPDDEQLFLRLASRLAEECSALVALTCLPGYYEDPKTFPWTKHKVGGYSLDEMVSAIRETVKILQSESTIVGNDDEKDGTTAAARPRPRPRLTGVFHDWGVMAGTMYTNRLLKEIHDSEKQQQAEEVAGGGGGGGGGGGVGASSSSTTSTKSTFLPVPDQLVLLDVLLGNPHPTMVQRIKANDVHFELTKDQLSWYDMIVTQSYRVVYALTFAVHQYLSRWLGMIILGLGGSLVFALRLYPVYKLDLKWKAKRRTPISKDRLVYMMYPYYQTFMVVLRGRMKQDFAGLHLPRDMIRTPVLYLYGTSKRVQFHSNSSIQTIRYHQDHIPQSRCKVVSVENAGHYLFLEKEEFSVNEMKKFIMDAS